MNIQRATLQDLADVMHIMMAAHGAMKDPTAYITDDEDYVAEHIVREGFVLLARMDGRTAGFFLVCIPGQKENNLGYYLNFSQQQLQETAIMDSAAVLPEYQGRGLMARMFQEAVRLTEGEYPYLLGTVAPENTASRRNFEKCGFRPVKLVMKPQGLRRLLMGRFRETPGGSGFSSR